MKLRGDLYPAEYTLAATRAHGVLLVRPLTYFLVAMTAWSFASALGAGAPVWRYLALALALWLVWLGVRGVARWVNTSYLLTNGRVVIRRGWGPGQDVSVPLAEIEGVSVGRRHLMGVTNAAALTVHARGVQHVLRAVPDPERFSREIQEAQRALLSGSTSRYRV
ncbi:MAG TPA: PH domain-containing protein [Candidatus Rothia avistercoris]|uniref:PH domain-containing protein n=1 Tax=Candidatus Rothia avistercoris TaxID=2840479 RepID=A0A9D2ZS62_9MICC|nr:PH domain-containing protein [Rothia nasimurium]HJD50346.1 PH domain-containing protein [Candidatus Rothia avistercoris]